MTEYEEIREQIMNKKFLTREDRFMIGQDKYETILNSLKPEEKGRIYTVVDIMDIHRMIAAKHSIVEVMRKYLISSRNAVYKVLGMEAPYFGQAPKSEEMVQVVVDISGKQSYARAKVTAEEVAEIVKAYSSGIPTYLIATKHQMKQEKVRNILRNNGVELEKSRSRLQRLSLHEKDRIDSLYRRGYSAERISEEMSLDEEQIKRYVRKIFGKKI